MSHAYDWRWDTSLNKDVSVIRVYREPFEPESYGWTEFNKKLRRAFTPWEDSGVFAFVLVKDDPGHWTPGYIRVGVTSVDQPWFGFAGMMADAEDVTRRIAGRIDLNGIRTVPDAELENLLTHELGHVLGLGHETTTGVKSVMRYLYQYPLPSEHDYETLRDSYAVS